MSDAAEPAQSPPPEEQKMEIHKPKPIHNWSEFLKEYAIIVLGVATALAAEQAVEWLHWQGEVEIGRKAIIAEMITDNGFYARRIAIAPCMDKMIVEAQGIIENLESKSKVAPFTVFHLAQGTPLSESEWQSERSSQALTHFPRGELALMSRYYAQIPQAAEWMREETAAWAELSILRRPPAGLSQDGIARLRINLALAQQLEYRMLLNSLRQMKISDQLGIIRVKPDSSRVEGFCKVSNDEKFWSDNLQAEMQP